MVLAHKPGLELREIAGHRAGSRYQARVVFCGNYYRAIGVTGVHRRRCGRSRYKSLVERR